MKLVTIGKNTVINPDAIIHLEPTETGSVIYFRDEREMRVDIDPEALAKIINAAVLRENIE
ncbi:MAG: hypothetical protein M3Y72_03450 [Acidobacteriota bacterium]|nr:hypothetical protein [Acidobacteriota bacterium]